MIRDETPKALRRLDRKTRLQRLLLGFEGLWRLLHWPLMVLGVALVVVASGILGDVPTWLRIALVLSLGLALLLSLWSLKSLVLPSRLQALRHMERHAAISHRMLSSAEDGLAPELETPAMEKLWEEHKRRQLAGLDHVAVVPPRSHWRSFDPRALRVPVLLSLAAALVLGPHDLVSNAREALRIGAPVAPLKLAMDAWLKPPAYTGRPPLLLTSPMIAEKLAAGEDITIPQDAQFTLRISGASHPSVQFLQHGSDPADATPLKDVAVKQAVKDGVLSAEAPIQRPVVIVVSDGAQELARWPVSPVPDAPPAITLNDKPTSDGKGKLTFKWLAQDDIGLRSIAGSLDLADDQQDGVGFDSNGIFLFDPPVIKPALRRPNAKEEKGSTTLDLAEHPWAGLRVTLNLSVTDGAGQEGAIAPTVITLPERVFVKPLPRALIEQRKQLIFYPDRAVHVGDLLDTAMLYPRGLVTSSGPIVAIGAIASRLRNATGYDDVKLAIDELWRVAVALEEGQLSDPKAELQALKAELEKALREGAPDERIAELMDRMRKATDRLMDAMRKEAERRMKDGTLKPNQQGQQGKSISREDLQKMLDDLEKMSKNGSRETAEQMLSELDQLLQNLEPGASQQGTGEGSDSQQDMMQGLGEVMKKQRGLMDDTQRMPGEGEDQQGQDGQGQDGQGQSGQSGQGADGLAQRQQDLRGMLDQLRGQGGGKTPDALGEAGKDMEGAAQSLREGDREGALRQQGQALDKLRRGAQEMAQQMRRGQGQNGQRSEDADSSRGDDDPLGRPRASRSVDEGPDKDMVPNEQAMRRAREILETLRAKANDRGLTDAEKAYIDRLLRGLY